MLIRTNLAILVELRAQMQEARRQIEEAAQLIAELDRQESAPDADRARSAHVGDYLQCLLRSSEKLRAQAAGTTRRLQAQVGLGLPHEPGR